MANWDELTPISFRGVITNPTCNCFLGPPCMKKNGDFPAMLVFGVNTLHLRLGDHVLHQELSGHFCAKKTKRLRVPIPITLSWLDTPSSFSNNISAWIPWCFLILEGPITNPKLFRTLSLASLTYQRRVKYWCLLLNMRKLTRFPCTIDAYRVWKTLKTDFSKRMLFVPPS